MTFVHSPPREIEWLPAAVRGFLWRRLREAFGILLLVAVGLVVVALSGWSPQDPNWNHVTAAAPSNPLGRAGAILADLSYQYLGWAGFLLCLPPALWGWRLLSHNAVYQSHWRAVAWLFTPLFAAVVLSLFPATFATSLPAGAGGSVGQFLAASLVNQMTGLVESDIFLRLFIGSLAGLAALLLLCYAMYWPFLSPPFDSGGVDAAPREEGKNGEEHWQRRNEIEPGWLRILGYKITDSIENWSDQFRGDPDSHFDELGETIVDHQEEDASRKVVSPRRSGEVVPTTADKRKGRRHAVQDGLDLVSAKTGDGRTIYRKPSLALLEASTGGKKQRKTRQELRQESGLLESVLADFGISGRIINVRNGPVVTLYELEPASGVKSSRVIGLADDIARSMSAVSTRIAVVPGRNAIGIELPNEHREVVPLRELLSCSAFSGAENKMKLSIILGKNITNDPIFVDLARMPHLLIAGTTGSGKSVAINSLILSLLYRLSPEQCRLIMIDPKMLELSVYDNIPHLLTPVVTDPKKAVIALKWLVREMEDRYRRISKLGVRNIETYNQRINEAQKKGESLKRTVQTGVEPETGKILYEDEELSLETMPYIVVVVDEMADLMLVAGKEIEIAVQRLAQMARAAGIHMIAATQRPSVDVITGTIKANFPNRISFQMTSKIDSRTILGEQGAEQLLGRGDMLYMSGGGRIERIHGAFLSDEDVERVARFLKQQDAPDYLLDVTTPVEDNNLEAGNGSEDSDPDQELYDRALSLIQQEKYASTSFIQRKLRIGYNRSARIIERMQERGVISAPNHVGRREVLSRAPMSSSMDNL